MRLQQYEVVAPCRASCAPSHQQVVDDKVTEKSSASSSKFFLIPGENGRIRDYVGIEKKKNGEEEEEERKDIMPPSGQDGEMELATDKVLSKGRILQELTKAVKLVSF